MPERNHTDKDNIKHTFNVSIGHHDGEWLQQLVSDDATRFWARRFAAAGCLLEPIGSIQPTELEALYDQGQAAISEAA